MTRVRAYAKVNLALVVGPRREDGLHEIATLVQRIDLADELELAEAPAPAVEGFPEDTLVAEALRRLGEAAGVEPRLRVRIQKRIPVAAGLGGGSSDAAGALVAANRLLPAPLPRARILELAAGLGSDVPFFVEPGTKLVEGGGERLTTLELPRDYVVVVTLPRGRRKRSTADVYARFDGAGGEAGFETRREAFLRAVAAVRSARDLGRLPPNDLAEAAGRPALVDELRAAGAFRADVSGAGPSVYGLFHRRDEAQAVARSLAGSADTWVTSPLW